MRSSKEKDTSQSSTSSSNLGSLSVDDQYIQHLRETFNCTLDDRTADIIKKTCKADTLERIYDDARTLRLLLAMHQAPRHWTPSLTSLRIIMMTGQEVALDTYCGVHSLSIKELIEQDPQLLHFAAIGGNTKILKTLMQQGCHPDALDLNAMSPLMFATLFRQMDAIDVLLANDANPHHVDNVGRNLYHCAVFSANTAMVDKVKALGVHIQATDYFNTTNQHFRAWQKDKFPVTNLTKPDTDPDKPGPSTTDGISVWHAQLVGGSALKSEIDEKLIKRLQDDPDLYAKISVSLSSLSFNKLSNNNFLDDFGHKDRALLQAAMHNNLRIFKRLTTAINTDWSLKLRKIVDCILLPDKSSGCTPIHYFAISSGLAGLKYCYQNLEDKADFYKVQDKEGNNVILSAAHGGNVNLLKWCLEQAKDPKALMQSTNNNGDTVLHAAAQSTNPAMIAFCLDHKLDINATNNDGQAAADLAAAHSSLPVILSLIDNGAVIKDPNALATNPYPSAVHWLLNDDNKLPLTEDTAKTLHQAFEQAGNTAGLRYLDRMAAVENSLKYFNKILSSSETDIIDQSKLKTLVDAVEDNLYHKTGAPPTWTNQCDALIQALPATTNASFKFSSAARRNRQIEKIHSHLKQLKTATHLNIYLHVSQQKQERGYKHKM